MLAANRSALRLARLGRGSRLRWFPSVPKPPQVPGREGAPPVGDESKQREPSVNDASHESVAPKLRRQLTASEKLSRSPLRSPLRALCRRTSERR